MTFIGIGIAISGVFLFGDGLSSGIGGMDSKKIKGLFLMAAGATVAAVGLVYS